MYTLEDLAFLNVVILTTVFAHFRECYGIFYGYFKLFLFF